MRVMFHQLDLQLHNMGKLTFTPSPAIFGKYEIVNTAFPVYNSKWGNFDFRDISEAEAAFLVEKGSIYIQPVKLPLAGGKKSSKV